MQPPAGGGTVRPAWDADRDFLMSARAVIVRTMEAVAAEQNRRLRPLSDELPLFDCGLDSLCFAILVARLEDELGADPFSEGEGEGFPTTFGDFVRFYDAVL